MRLPRVPTLLATAVLLGGGATAAHAAHHDRATTSPSAGVIRTAGLSSDELTRARSAVALLDGIFNQHRPRATITKYISASGYRQHNPGIPNGRAAVITAFEALAKGAPDSSLSIKRVIAQGNLVVVHGVLKVNPADRGTVELDIFRFDRANKVVEHWDVLQQVAATSVNGNPQA